MPVHQKLLDNNKMFANLKQKPWIINDLMNSTTRDRENVQHLITTTYSTDLVSTLPTCKCGQTKGEFSRNTVCEKCGTSVSSTIEDTIEPLVWFRRPKGVEKLMAPIIWIMTEERFTKGKFSTLRWLTDTSYAPQMAKPAHIERMEEMNIPRGYNNFIQNFFSIINYLLNTKEFKAKRGVEDWYPVFLEENKDILFSDYIPLLNKTLLIIEKTSFATYIDSTVPLALDAIEMLVSIDQDFHDKSSMTLQNRTARAFHILGVKFYKTYFKQIVARKTGLLRHYIGGSRFDYSARAVISSITDSHKYDEIIVPWGIGLVIFRPMLINKLIRKSNMMLNHAQGLLLSHTGIYHPLLDKYMEEIISETKEGRYPVIFNRFPSLLQGSIQKVYIPRIKKDPKDLTLGISILAVTAPNADFDGKYCRRLNFLNCWKFSRDALTTASRKTKPRFENSAVEIISSQAPYRRRFNDYRKAA